MACTYNVLNERCALFSLWTNESGGAWHKRVGQEIREDANDICHGRLSPAFVDLGMTLLARFRADVVSGTCSDSLLRLFFPGLMAQAADKKD